MGNRNCSRTPSEKLKIMQYAEKYGMAKACEKFDITERSIWRYKSIYDGTLESLVNKSSRALMPHPAQHTEEEINNIREVLSKYPYISHKELYEKLKTEYGYTRHIGGLYNYLRRHNMRPEPKQKNEYATMFDEKAVKTINAKYIFDNRDKLPLYVIELSDLGIFISSNASNYPCKMSVYYSVALTFTNLDEAQKFVKSIKNTSKFKLNIRELKQ